MKKFYLLILGVAISTTSIAQTKTTNDLHKRFDDSFALFFYSSTLKMLNQNDDKEFDELVKDIEKMKFLLISKADKKFSDKDYASLIKNYKAENYENMMSARSMGKNFDVYLREESGNVKGTIILVNDSTQLYVLDILGRVQPSQVTKFFAALDKNSDIGQKIKSFIGSDDDDKKKKLKQKGIVID